MSKVNSGSNSEDSTTTLGPKDIYQCFQCDRTFNSGQALGGHQNAHRENRSMKRPDNVNGAHINNINHHDLAAPAPLALTPVVAQAGAFTAVNALWNNARLVDYRWRDHSGAQLAYSSIYGGFIEEIYKLDYSSTDLEQRQECEYPTRDFLGEWEHRERALRIANGDALDQDQVINVEGNNVGLNLELKLG